MATASAIGLGVAAVGGIVKTVSGAKQKREAQNELDNYQRQELQNYYEDLQVSTLGSDLQREELARSQATSVDALRSGGVRGLVGGLGQVQQQGNQVARGIGANLDEQQKAINQQIAAEDSRLQGVREQRENAYIGGLNQQRQAGEANFYGGLGDIAGVGLATASAAQKGALDFPRGKQETLAQQGFGIAPAQAGAVQNPYNPLDSLVGVRQPVSAIGAGLGYRHQPQPIQNLSPTYRNY